MNKIEEQAIKNYNDNLLYLEKEHIDLFKKIDILNIAIENRSYKERYSLEYKNDYFDVYELSSKNYLFNSDSNKYADKLTKQVNFKKSENVLENFYNINITPKILKKYSGNKAPLDSPLFACVDILDYVNKNTSTNDEMKYISKFIFAGTGLSLHLASIIDKTKASSIFIIEDNIELFRLSLFTISYKELSKKTKITFSIMENDLELSKTFSNFYNEGYNNNKYLKYTLFSQNESHLIKKLQHHIVTSQFLSYPYSMLLREHLKAPEYLVENFSYLDVSKVHNLPLFSNKPVLLIASGPSLDKHAQWLKDNKEKFIIISVMSALPSLYNLNVQADIVTHIDPQDKGFIYLENIDIEKFCKNTIFVFSSVVSRTIVDKISKKQIYIFESLAHYKQNYGTLTAPSIGETTYALSLIFGTKTLYLLGLDLALDPDTKKSHSDKHKFSTILEEENSEKNEDYTSIYHTISYIKGNFLPEVPITPLFRLSVIGFEKISKKLLINNQKIYNLNNGAYLEGSIPKMVEDIDMNSFNNIDKKDIQLSLHNELNKISQNYANEDDIQYLTKQLDEAERLLKFINHFNETVHISNYDIYMKSFYKLSSELIGLNKEDFLDINHIFYSYMQYTSSHIFDLFNTKNLKNTKRHIKKINSIFTNEILKILDRYIKTLNVYIMWVKK